MNVVRFLLTETLIMYVYYYGKYAKYLHIIGAITFACCVRIQYALFEETDWKQSKSSNILLTYVYYRS